MKILLSPTKKQIVPLSNIVKTQPIFINEAEFLVEKMKTFTQEKLKKKLSISDKLNLENWEKLQEWSKETLLGSPAILTFTGEAFNYLAPGNFSPQDLEYAQSSLRIFSGLYGFLKPMDSIMNYRLDIKDSITDNSKNLYEYWGFLLTEYMLNDLLEDPNPFIVNLSSKEYSKSINFKQLNYKVITPDFKTKVNGKLKTVAIWSKRMRGLMARELIINRITNIDEIKNIILPNYKLAEINNDNYLYIKDEE